MRSRVLTAIGLIPFVLGAFFCASPWPMWLLALAAALICSIELAGLLRSWLIWLGLPIWAALATVIIKFTWPQDFASAAAVLLSTSVGVAGLYAYDTMRWKPLAAMLAPLWFLAPLYSLICLHGIYPFLDAWSFKRVILLAVLPLWGGDTAGIFVGKAIGKHLLAPKISPGKTIEGAFANLVVCVAVAVPLARWIGVSWKDGLACGLWAGVFGQVGDLFESFVKRRAGVKDSGGLLPGHGGLLDRIDSILFTAPFVYALLAWVLRDSTRF